MVFVTLAAWTCRRSPSFPIGSSPLRLKTSSASTSNRLKFRPSGAKAASILACMICCTRVIEVAASIASTDPHSNARQFFPASSIGSKLSPIACRLPNKIF